MNYLVIRDEAVRQIQAGIISLYPKMRVEAHGGTFTEQSIKQNAQRTPAILTSLVKAADGTQNNSITFVSWVLYRASSEDKLYDGALKIVSALTSVIQKADFDLDIKDTVINAECLYSGTLDAMAVTMWAVKWELLLGSRAFSHRSLEELGELENFDDTALIDTVQL